jgi:flagellum-specific ATP synthase
VAAVEGGLVALRGLDGLARLGDAVRIDGVLDGEVAGLGEGLARVVPNGPTAGIGTGRPARLVRQRRLIAASPAWFGRIVTGHGAPLDGGPPPLAGPRPRPLDGTPPPAAQRRLLGAKIATGVRVLDAFTPLCRGQRLGIFAGSGVGKSTLVAQLARFAAADAVVLALVGERGREVQMFLQQELPDTVRGRTVTVVATSDEPALARRDAARGALAIAEGLRDQGLHVLLLFDSVTRYAMALRDLALAAGEPPATKGYPASVFAELPRLVERAGPGAAGQGDITALFSVLVDGGDHDEPVADAVRGLLDGHVVLSRAIAERGRFPAVDVLRSVSRSLPRAHDASELATMQAARRLIADHAAMAEMIELGAYKPGGNAALDRAIACQPALEAVLTQTPEECSDPAETFARLAEAVA